MVGSRCQTLFNFTYLRVFCATDTLALWRQKFSMTIFGQKCIVWCAVDCTSQGHTALLHRITTISRSWEITETSNIPFIGVWCLYNLFYCSPLSTGLRTELVLFFVICLICTRSETLEECNWDRICWRSWINPSLTLC